MQVSMSPKAMVKLNDEQRWRMVFLAKLGLSHRGISKILMISRCAIANTLKKYQKAGSVADLPQSGRPRKTTLWQDRRIVRMSLKNRKNTAVDLRREINSELSKPDEKISESTVRNRLKEANLNGQVACKKPYLRTVNKKKRLQWAKEHEHWTVEDWKKVVWSDESSFTLLEPLEELGCAAGLGRNTKRSASSQQSSTVVVKSKYGGVSRMAKHQNCF